MIKKFKINKNLLLFITFVIFLFSNFSLDLTEDRRYTIQDCSLKILDSIDENIELIFFIDGKLPYDLIFFKENIKNYIDSLNSKKNKIKYKFIDFESLKDDDRKFFYKIFKEKKINPTTLIFKKDKDHTVERIIYPAVVIKYKEKIDVFNIFSKNNFSDLKKIVNDSISNLEFTIISSIKRITSKKKKIALLRSHGTASDLILKDCIEIIKNNYQYIEFFLEKNSIISPKDFESLIIVDPVNKFCEEELYNLDQYLMQGGNLIFFLNPMTVDMNSLERDENISVEKNTGIEIFLYKYGIILNSDLVQDIQCSKYPIVLGKIGNRNNISNIKWPFFPIITHFEDHQITNGLDAIYAQFCSSISFFEQEDQKINFIPLFFTSQNTFVSKSPIFFNKKFIKLDLDKNFYETGHIILSAIIEGEFSSIFLNSIILPKNSKESFISHGKSKIFLGSSSSFIKNIYHENLNSIFPMGYDPFEKRELSNQIFFINLLNFFSQEKDFLSLKNKRKKINILNIYLIEDYKKIIQISLLLLPIILNSCLFLFFLFLRRRKKIKF
jgi:ABC-2 type transport system permease protein